MSGTIQKLKRLGTMPPDELGHRVREKMYLELDRLRTGDGKPAAPLGFAFKDYLAGAPSRRFYRGPRENLRPFVAAMFPNFLERAVAEAEKLCRHEVELLGCGTVDLGAAIDWHRDPVKGCAWERTYWANYDPVHDQLGRDAKTIHELNRHQHLPRLAKAYLLTGDERYAREAVAQLNSWIEQDPPGLGINWQSSLEIGIRAISWLWTMFLLLPSRALDAASAQRIGESLFEQLDHVCRYTSLYSSPNTHLVGEATALFIAGLVFRDQERASVWFERGATLLVQEVKKQISPDGVYGELSTCYHCYALDFYLQALAIAGQNQFRLSRHVRQAACDMLQFLMHVTRPDGTIPALGDDDGGRALALAQRDYRSFQDALCLGAVLYQRGDFKQQAGAFAEETLWLLGVDSWEAYRQLEAARPEETCGYFPSSGYWIQRSGWGPLASHLVFDCGGLGILTGGHAHADALSVTLFSKGRELLVDPGTFVYNGAPDWRSYFRSTAAHNTVSIDGRDQVEQGGTFRWKARLDARLTGEYNLPAIEYLEGEHNGYEEVRGVIHRRRVVHVPAGYWILADDFRGAGSHTFDFHYHFAPDVRVSRLEHEGAALMVSAEDCGFRLSMHGAHAFAETEIVCGWASRQYGERRPCSTLRATLRGTVPSGALTILEPNASANTGTAGLSLEYGSGIACSIRGEGYEDIVVLSIGDAPISVAGFHMQGEFFWLRLSGGLLQQVLAIRATSLEYGGVTFFSRLKPGPYYAAMDAEAKKETLCVESAGL